MTPARREVFSAASLSALCSDVFQRVGMAVDDADYAASSLVEADLRGIESHGVTRLIQFSSALENGAFNAAGKPSVVSRTGSVARMDGDAALGAIAARDAVAEAVEMAGQHGVGVVAVDNSNPFGAAYLYPLAAADRKMIGYITTNGPRVMPVHGGRQRSIGNNPLAWAIPTLEEPPIVLDMACMVAARGKISLAAREGRDIPVGWALDSVGAPTTDPIAALEGHLLPLGGAKGSGLAVIHELLAGALTGARVLGEVADGVVATGRFEAPTRIGHFVIVLDPGALMPLPEFLGRVEDVRRELRGVQAAEGVDQILMPGELEFLVRAERLRSGIPVAASTVEQLRALDEHDRLTAAGLPQT